MSTELTLAEFAEHVAPREFGAWRAMRRILSDNTAISPTRAARVGRAAVPLFAKHRAAYMERYRIDEQTFLPAVNIVREWDFPGMLARCPDPTERERMITELATGHARDEAMQPLLDRYRRQCNPLPRPSKLAPIYRSYRRRRTIAERIAAKLLAAMIRPGITVTATHDGVNRRALARVELQKATVNLAKDALTVGQQAWSLVQIEMPDDVAAAVSPISRAANDDEIMSWMMKCQQTLKQRNEKHGRDVVLKAAVGHFGKSRKAMLEIWNSGWAARRSR